MDYKWGTGESSPSLASLRTRAWTKVGRRCKLRYVPVGTRYVKVTLEQLAGPTN